MIIIHENQFANAYYEPEKKIIWHKYVGLSNAGLIILCHSEVMKFVKTNPTSACFYDLTNVEGTFTKAINFIAKEYEPALAKNGVKYGSFAMKDKDIFTKFAMSQMFKLMRPTIELKVHKNIEDAMKWLGGKISLEIDYPEEIK